MNKKLFAEIVIISSLVSIGMATVITFAILY